MIILYDSYKKCSSSNCEGQFQSGRGMKATQGAAHNYIMSNSHNPSVILKVYKTETVFQHTRNKKVCRPHVNHLDDVYQIYLILQNRKHVLNLHMQGSGEIFRFCFTFPPLINTDTSFDRNEFEK